MPGMDYTLRELSVKRKTTESSKRKALPGERRFRAEAAYADSIFRDALGDREGSIVALKRALEAMPTYAPAILSLGSVLYQAGRITEGRLLFHSLLSLPKNTTDICQIIDEAGNAGLHEEAVSANQRALELDPENQQLVNDLGWTLLQAGRLPEARETLERAVSMDPSDELANENLRFCRRQAGHPQNG